MSITHVLLGLMAARPAYGYDLKHAHDDTFPATKPLAYGQVYAALAKLEKDGLVDVVESASAGGPERKTYAISDLGRAALEDWVSSPEAAGPYAADELVRKTVTSLRIGRDAAHFLTAQRRIHLATMKSLLTRQADAPNAAAALVIDHAVEHLDADLRWLDNAILRLARPPRTASERSAATSINSEESA